MILSAIIYLMGFIVSMVVFLLPTASILPVNFSDLLTDFFAEIYGWDWLFPVSTLLSVLSSIIIFKAAELSWQFGKFLLSLFRGN